MSEGEGWGGKSLKQHIEAAQDAAAEALEASQAACIDLEVMREELAELRRAVGLSDVADDAP